MGTVVVSPRCRLDHFGRRYTDAFTEYWRRGVGVGHVTCSIWFCKFDMFIGASAVLGLLWFVEIDGLLIRFLRRIAQGGVDILKSTPLVHGTRPPSAALLRRAVTSLVHVHAPIPPVRLSLFIVDCD